MNNAERQSSGGNRRPVSGSDWAEMQQSQFNPELARKLAKKRAEEVQGQEATYELPGDEEQAIVPVAETALGAPRMPGAQPIEAEMIANEVVRPELPPADNEDRLALPPAKEDDSNRPDPDPIPDPTDGDLEPVSDDPALEPLDPLVAGNVSRDAELKNAAKDIGERQLQKEVEEAKGIKGFFIKRWKNNYARKYYEKKYEKQAEAWIAATERGYAYDADGRRIELADAGGNVALFDENGDKLKRFEMTADDWQLDRKSSVERVVSDDLDDFQDYLSAEAGEKRLDENEELTQITRSIIEDFVKQVQNEPDRRVELEANMRAAMHNLSHMGSLARKAAGAETRQVNREVTVAQYERGERGQRILSRDENGNLIKRTQTLTEEIPEGQLGNLDNYAEVAITALNRVEHGYALENVMEGFRVVNGQVNEGARTEEHQDAIDRIVSKWEGSRFGHLMPPEFIAGAAGMAGYFVKSFATSAVKAATFGIGGSAVTGLAAGLRERAHVSADRARMLRDMSGGLVKDGAKSKYETKLFGTAYEMRSADDLVESMNTAQESGDFDAIMKSLVEVEARRLFSDGEKKDLISYTNPEQRSKEYLGLMTKMSELKRSMTPEQRTQFEQMHESMMHERVASLAESVDAKDRVFAKVRRRQAIKQGVKTGVVAFGSMVVAQEVLALVDPGKFGALESVLNKNGVLNTANNTDASETMLAGFTGQHQVLPAGVRDGGTIDGTLSDEQKAALKERGGSYREYKVPVANTETQTVTHVGGEEIPGVSGRYLTEDWGNNGTSVSDGNELGIWNGPRPGTFVTHMSGDSWTEMHGAMNFEDDVANGRLMGYLTVDQGAQAVRIPIPAEVTEDGQLLFDNPILRQFIGPDGRFHGAFFEVAKETGVDANGVTHLISYATEVGDGLQSTYDVTEAVETVTEQVKTAILEPKFEETEADVVWGPFAAFVKRDGLSRMTRGDGSTPGGVGQAPQGGNGGGEAPAPSGEVGGGDGGGEATGNRDENPYDGQFNTWWNGLGDAERQTYTELVTGTGMADGMSEGERNNALSGMMPELRDWIRQRTEGGTGDSNVASVAASEDGRETTTGGERREMPTQQHYEEWWDGLGDAERQMYADLVTGTGAAEGMPENERQNFLNNISPELAEWLRDRSGESVEVIQEGGAESVEATPSEERETVGNAGYGGRSDFFNRPVAPPVDLPSGITIPDDIRAGWDREWDGNPDNPADSGMSPVWKHSYLSDDDWLNGQTETYRASDGLDGFTGEEWVNMRKQYINEKRSEAIFNSWWNGLDEAGRQAVTDLVMGTGIVEGASRGELQSVLDGMPGLSEWIRRKVRRA